MKEGPPQVVPIEMWATLPKGECIGSWENPLSMEGRQWRFIPADREKKGQSLVDAGALMSLINVYAIGRCQ